MVKTMDLVESEMNSHDQDFKTKYTSPKSTSENEECVIFQQLDLFTQGFPIMEEIRRQGKLCDVTLKVFIIIVIIVMYKLKITV